MHRIKLNDRMTFPDLLNLNPFVEAQEPPAATADDSANGQCEQDASAEQFTAVESVTIDAQMGDCDKLPPNDGAKEDVAMVGATGESDDEGICVDGTMGGGNSSAGRYSICLL